MCLSPFIFSCKSFQPLIISLLLGDLSSVFLRLRLKMAMQLVKMTTSTMLECVAAPLGASHPSFPSVGESQPPGSPGGFSPGKAEFVI